MFSNQPLLDLWLDRLAIYYKGKKTEEKTWVPQHNSISQDKYNYNFCNY